MTDYTDVATVKAAVGKTAVEQDTNIARIITAISRAIDNRCNRPDGFVAADVATARTYAGSGGTVQRIDETPEITAVAVKSSSTDVTYTAWAATDWIAFSGDPLSPDYNHTPYTQLMIDPNGDYSQFTSGWGSDELSWSRRGRGMSRLSSRRSAPPTVKVTAKWGYATDVPPVIAEACIIESARLFKLATSNYADALVSENLGRLIMIAKLHPATVMMLEQGRFIRANVG